MLNSISTYISQNIGDIIVQAILVVISVLLPLILTKKDTNPIRTNTTSVQQTLIYIKQTIITINSPHPSTPKSSGSNTYKTSNSNNDDVIGLLIIAAIAAGLYSKYHIQIINYFTGFTVLVLISTITLAIKLYRNNNYDKLNKWWTILMFIVILFNLVIIALMKNQNVTISGDLFLLTKVLYYLIGLLFFIVPNIFILFLIIHLFALNSFLSRRGKISLFFLHKTKFLLHSPKVSSAIAIGFCIVGLLFSSGIALELLYKFNNNNLNDLMETINQ
jgi:hypothetical protein